MDSEDTSDLSSIPSSPLSSPPASPIILPTWRAPTPPPSQENIENAEEDMPPARKRRKIEPKIRTTQHLDLTSEVTHSEYDHRNSSDLLLKTLRKRRKIVVIAGAGISVSAGIPDFRSSHGLFQSLRTEHRLKSSGKELFDASVYKDDLSTASFHDMVRDLSKLAAEAKPTPFHQLLARLAQEGRLLRLYTQNVDGIDTSLPPLATQVPLRHKGPWPQTIQLHGGLEKMMCQKCRHTSKFQAQLFHGPKPPLCPECAERDSLRTTHAGKRSHGIGKLRPRIVLYNEHNPDEEAIGAVVTADLRTRPDAVLVVGTSMKIPGVKRIVREMCSVVRSRQNGVSMWINRDPVPPGKDFEDCWDLVIKGDCDEVAHQVDLKEVDYQSADPPEEYTMSDVERVKARQGPISVVVPPTPQKKDSTKHMAGIMTPPLDAGEVSNGFKVKPIKLKPRMSPSSEKHIKNPASVGRSLVDVLGKENKMKQVGKRKGIVSKKGLVKAGKVLSLSVITGKVTKPPSAKWSKPESKKATSPLSPRRDQNSIVLFPNLSQQHSSAEPSPAPDSPIPRDWQNGNTISPTGCLPSGMARLLT